MIRPTAAYTMDFLRILTTKHIPILRLMLWNMLSRQSLLARTGINQSISTPCNTQGRAQ